MTDVASLRTGRFTDDTAHLAGRAIRIWSRNPASIAGAVVFPLLFFGLFNLVMRRLMQARGFDYAQLLPSTVVVQAMFFAAMSSAYYVAADRLSGVMARLRSLPIHRAAPIVARSLGDMSRATISVVVLLLVGIAAGMRLRAGVGGAIGFVLVALVFVGVVALGMGLLGYRASSPDAAASMASMPYLPLVMLSNGFAPLSDFPGWLQPFVRHQPVTRTIDVLRALSSGGSTVPPLAIWAGWMVGLAFVFAVLSARAFAKAA